MGNYGWTLSVLLIGAMVSCASRALVEVDFSAGPNPLNETEQIAGQFSVTSVNGEAEYRIQEENANGKQLVSIIADAPISTSALLLKITYDAGEYSPLVVHLGEKLLGLPDALVLESMEQAGTVDVGVVPISGQPIEISKDETVVQIMFEPAEALSGKPIRSVSRVPASANAVVPLLWDDAEGELRWYLVNPGDYDQNGEVGLSDLMPLAVHFGEAGPFEYTQIQAVVDGNGDGEINLQDITPIAQGFGNTVQGYNLYASDNIADIPRGYTEPSVIEPVATFMLAEAANADAVTDERLSFSYIPSVEQQELMFWARPYEVSPTGTVSEGTRSNINGPAISQNPDPDGPDFNFAPVASLSLEFLGSNVPLDVLLDGSASYDTDGYIAFYEWDFEGDGLIDAYSTDAVIAHTYNMPGTYSPTLIVTDNHGSRDTFTSPPFTATRDEVSNIEPFADLYATEYSGTPPLTVGLIATGSSDVDGYFAKYEWDFDGDGTIDLESGMDPTVMHTYEEPGVFACRVTVTDDAGASAFAEVEIEVLEIIANTPPIAVLTADPAYGDEGVSVTLDASGSIDPNGEIVKYEFDFDGDGFYEAYGGSPTYSHTYIDFGVFEAAVRVTDDSGAQDTATTSVRINEVFDLDHPWGSQGHDARHTGRSPFVGAQTNNLKWFFDAELGVTSSPVVSADGTVYLGNYDGKLRAINPDGTLKWTFSSNYGSVKSPAIGIDGTVYVGRSGGKLYAVNPDGSLDWSLYIGGYFVSSPVIGEDGTVYVGVSPASGDELFAINSDGTIKWSFSTGDDVSSSPAIGSDGTVYVGCDDNKLYAINPDGSEKWSYTTFHNVNSSPAVDEDGTVYVGSDDNRLYSINPDGSLKWFYTTGDDIDSSPAIGVDGTVYVGSNDNNLYAINPDGTFKWSYTTGGAVLSSPAIDADGTVYVGSNDDSVYAINPDGTLKWSFATGDDVVSFPAIGAFGTVYVGSKDDKLYAISNLSPTAVISATPTGGLLPLDVTLDASSSYSDNGYIRSYDWDFDGDGVFDQFGISKQAYHTYTDAGTYNARLRVTDTSGYTASATVKISVFNPGEWGTQYLGAAVTWGSATSLAIINGNPAISYSDQDFGTLWYVRASDVSGYTWETPVVVDSTVEVLENYFSITLTTVNGNPAISYFDNTDQDLKYVRATDTRGANWGTPVNVVTEGTVGIHHSMAIVDGNPAIGYYDSTNGSLQYVQAADANGSTWRTPITVDSEWIVGVSTSLTVVDGKPSISYYNGSSNSLRFVRALDSGGDAWGTPITLYVNIGGGRTTMYTSLVVVNGNPAIAFFDNSYGQLKYIRATDVSGSTWGAIVEVDVDGTVGQYTSMAVVGGNPAISYWDDWPNYDLKYVQATDANGSAWETPVVIDATGDLGSGTSLAVVNGSPAISYYDSTNFDLKFARLY